MSIPRLQAWVLAARPKTLPVAIAPVIVGSAMAWDAGGFHLVAMVVATVCALLITIGTNFCNDYADFIKGADTETRKGPTRVTQAGLIPQNHVKIATIVVFLFAFILGMVLVYRGGWGILILGLASILAGIFYTAGPWPFGYKGLGDVFVLIFFGPVAVGGTYFVQTLEITSDVIIAGFASGLLGTAILVVNNIRDIDEDRHANKLTLVVRCGRNFGVGLWAGCVLVAMLLPVGLVMITGEHGWAALTLILLIPAMKILHGLITIKESVRLNPYLGQTALLLLSFSVIFALGWVS